MAWLDPSWGNRKRFTVDNSSCHTLNLKDKSAGDKWPASRVNVYESRALHKNGYGSLYVSGSGYFQLADHADWQLGGGTGDFTIEAWIYRTAAPTAGFFSNVICQRVDDNNSWVFAINNAAGPTYTLVFSHRYGGSQIIFIEAAATADLGLNKWAHIAVTRESDDFKLWVNGSQIGATVTDSDSIADLNAALSIGRFVGGDSRHIFTGYIDDLRISDVARYTGSFTPSASSLVNDSDTVLLYNFEPDDGELADHYQTLIYVGQSSGATGEDIDCEGYVLDSFDDLRFTENDGVTLLPYWIEEITGANPNLLAKVWVKLPNFAQDTPDFYMYYNNPGASAYSNGDDTFEFFDDFDGPTLDTSKWYTIGSPTLTFSSGILRITATSSAWHAIASQNPFSPPYTIEARSRSPDYDTWSQNIGFCTHPSTTDQGDTVGWYNTSTSFASANGGTGSWSGSVSLAAGEWYRNYNKLYNPFMARAGIKRESTGVTRTGTKVFTTLIGRDSLYPGIGEIVNGDFQEHDFFLVRKGCDAEPVFGSTYSEELYTTPVPTTLLPTTLSPTTLLPTTLLPTTLAPTTIVGTTVVPTTVLTTPAPSLGGGRLVGGKLINNTILFGRLVQ